MAAPVRLLGTDHRVFPLDRTGTATGRISVLVPWDAAQVMAFRMVTAWLAATARSWSAIPEEAVVRLVALDGGRCIAGVTFLNGDAGP